MNIPTRTVTQAVNLAHDNMQLRAQVDRLKETVHDLDAEIATNREVIAAQAKRILELEQGIREPRARVLACQASCEEFYAVVSPLVAVGEVVAEVAA